MARKENADEKAKRLEAAREAVKRAQEELRREERRQKGPLQNVHEDSKGIAEVLRKRSLGLAFKAIGLSKDKKTADPAGPVLGFVSGLSTAFALAAVSVPFAAVARTTRIAAAITGQQFK